MYDCKLQNVNTGFVIIGNLRVALHMAFLSPTPMPNQYLGHSVFYKPFSCVFLRQTSSRELGEVKLCVADITNFSYHPGSHPEWPFWVLSLFCSSQQLSTSGFSFRSHCFFIAWDIRFRSKVAAVNDRAAHC